MVQGCSIAANVVVDFRRLLGNRLASLYMERYMGARVRNFVKIHAATSEAEEDE